MKKLVFVVALVLLLNACGAGKSVLSADSTPIKTAINLVNIVNDRAKVEVDPGVFTPQTVVFRIPKTVPGTYSTDNYGKYIEDFEAIDYNGNNLIVVKLDENSWSIADGANLDKLWYWVNDTYDTENEMEDAVFSPAGTNIEKGSNFMLNLHGFVGYFDGLKEVSYELEIQKPSALVSTTSLKNTQKSTEDNKDMFFAERYFEVIDNPIMYTRPNTETFEISGITVTLSLYSPTGVYKAADLKDRMAEMMGAQKAFLGEINSTKAYSILLYLSDLNKPDAQGFGALEHHTSTVVVLPEAMPLEGLEQAMFDVVSHEFFHIVTPLSVHSREIQYFDFNDPKMSQHLWMYEGTTEYFANLFQIQQGLISNEAFYDRIFTKINNAKYFDDTMSFTIMSKNILEEPYQANYANVYEKGTLINMALDILLREKSNGEKGMLWLMKELSKKYGTDNPFNDYDLLVEIEAMTYPEVKDFFNEHVVGETPIDYELFLGKVGLGTMEVPEQTGYFLDKQVPYIDVNVEKDSLIFVREGLDLNSFFTDLKLQGGDVIKKINGEPLTIETLRTIIGESFGWAAETKIQMEVERDGSILSVQGPVGVPTKMVRKVVPLEDASSKEVDLRNAWLKG